MESRGSLLCVQDLCFELLVSFPCLHIYLFMIHFDINFLLTPRFVKFLFLSGFLDEILCVFHFPVRLGLLDLIVVIVFSEE
jgi:hypothetical protein